MSGSRPSLRAVASAADVSVSTVARFVKGELTLRPDTEARVLEAMDQAGYPRPHPRDAKSAEAQLHRRVIGVIVPDLANPYFGRAADALATAARSHGYSSIVTSSQHHARYQEDDVQLMHEQGVDGLIYVGDFRTNPALSAAVEEGLPTLVFDEHVDELAAVDEVLVDDFSGGFQATTYLMSLGHSRIAFLAGPADLRSVAERKRGWLEALSRSGIDASRQISLHGTYDEESGATALPHLLGAQEPPTAVFAAADVIAVGVLNAARRLGVRVPDDLSVVGFDDVPIAASVTPRLTTISIPLRAMAASAVATLLKRIDNPSAKVRTIVTPVSLVVGDSASHPTVAEPQP